jgi:2-C-methyl-D-erythritol 4-phosphate cytidylyltransferase
MNIALILSGGVGSRLGGDVPKQYLRVNERMIISYCVETLLEHEKIDGLLIVAEPSWESDIEKELGKLPDFQRKFCGFAKPGENRQLSIYNGLCKIQNLGEEDVCVLIHDAARPLVSARQISDCFAALDGHDGVMPALPMKDTVYISKGDNRITELLDRTTLFAGQAPELFRLERYLEACRALLPDRIKTINGSSEPAVMAGLDIVMIAGDEGNYKITTREDLERFQNVRN